MAGMSDPRELFLHELGDVLYAENVLVKALPKLAEEASDEELALGFEEHLEETRQHVKNIEQAFEQLGEEPSAEKCPGIEGIKKEHDEFVSKESPSQDVLDSFLTGAGARTCRTDGRFVGVTFDVAAVKDDAATVTALVRVSRAPTAEELARMQQSANPSATLARFGQEAGSVTLMRLTLARRNTLWSVVSRTIIGQS